MRGSPDTFNIRPKPGDASQVEVRRLVGSVFQVERTIPNQSSRKLGVYGLEDNDVVTVDAGVNPKLYLSGGDDNDDLNASGANSPVTLLGAGGKDALRGGNAGDYIEGGSGNDSLYGYGGNDSLYGNSGLDLIYGGDGNDLIDGGSDEDTLYGQNGDDLIRAVDGAVDRGGGGAGTDDIDQDAFDLLTA